MFLTLMEWYNYVYIMSVCMCVLYVCVSVDDITWKVSWESMVGGVG